MSDIPAELIDAMMVKCARRCSICRRFRPTKLHVHHIIERSNGGSDDEDNLIVVCLSCHSDVHTKAPFARRFSPGELKGHRDALVTAVANGQFPVDDTDDTDQAISMLITQLRLVARPSLALLPEAAEILLTAVAMEGGAQGIIQTNHDESGLDIIVGSGTLLSTNGDRRSQARYKRGLKQLLDSHLVDQVSDDFYEVSYDGYLAADEIASRGSSFLA